MPKEERKSDPVSVDSKVSDTDSVGYYKEIASAIRNGLDCSMFFSEPEFSFFPENLDNPTSVEYDASDLSINGCVLRSVPTISHFKVSVILKGSDNKARRAVAMIDSGADGIFLDRRWAERQGIALGTLKREIKVKNIDGTFNQAGSIKQYAALQMQSQDHVENLRFLVTELGSEDIILGLP